MRPRGLICIGTYRRASSCSRGWRLKIASACFFKLTVNAVQIKCRQRLAVEVRGKATRTDYEQGKLNVRSDALARKIDAWIDVQNLYMTDVFPHRRLRAESDGEEDETHTRPLFLPSTCIELGIKCSRRLLRHEFQLRLAQAQATLHELRGTLLHRSRLIQSKTKYGSGTEQMTRSNKLIQEVYAKCTNLSKKYNANRAALELLGEGLGERNWATVFLPLTDADVKGPTSMDVEVWGEGKKTLTWIWKVRGVSSNIDDLASTSKYPYSF